jgi:hypothetical protein
MDRLSGLRRHPLSMASERNRRLATIALLGVDGTASLDADLATAAVVAAAVFTGPALDRIASGPR